MNTMGATAGKAARAPARRQRWLMGLAALAGLLTLGVLAGGWALVDAVGMLPVSLTIDGERVLDGIDLAGLPPDHKLALAATLLFGVLTAVLVVPMALGLLLLGLALAVLLPLAIALAALALVTAPLWLLAWALWRAVAGRPAGAGA